MTQHNIPQETIDKLKSKHGDIVRVGSGDNTMVFRGPGLAEWQAFIDDVGKHPSHAQYNLASQCCVWPEPNGSDRSAFQAIAERKPGLISLAVGEIAELSGAGSDDTGKL